MQLVPSCTCGARQLRHCSLACVQLALRFRVGTLSRGVSKFSFAMNGALTRMRSDIGTSLTHTVRTAQLPRRYTVTAHDEPPTETHRESAAHLLPAFRR